MNHFLNPWALLALASVPLLILLYFLKLKRPQVTVSSTLLWQKVIEDMRVNSPFQRLRRSLLLLLQLLLLLALIFALARFVRRGLDTSASSVVALVDTSASMQAREPGGQTRLELARARLSAIANTLGRGGEMTIIEFGAQARVAASYENNPRMLREAIRGLQATDGPTNVRPALDLARSLALARARPRILLFSDGGFDDPGLVELPAPIEYEKIGSAVPNLGITGLDVRRHRQDRQRIEMFVAVQNFSQEPLRGSMKVFLDDRLLDSKPIAVEEERTLSQIFEAALPEGGVVRVELDVPDALATDNRAWQVVPPPVPRRLLVVGESSYFVERCFRGAPQIVVEGTTLAGYDAAASGAYFAVIWTHVPTPGVALTNNLYLGCAPAVPNLSLGEALKDPAVVDWDSAHPLCRFLDFSNLLLGEAPRLALPEAAHVVLRASGTPLIATWSNDGFTICVSPFDYTKSNWPLLVSFPLFLNNFVQYCEDRMLSGSQQNLAVGSPLAVRSPGGPPELVLPSGAHATMVRGAEADYSFAGVTRQGVYRLSLPGQPSRTIAANLFSPRESSLTPVDDPIPERKALKTVKLAGQVAKEFSRYLLAGVLALLLIEWLVYHRRILT